MAKSLLGICRECDNVPRLCAYAKTHSLVPLRIAGRTVGLFSFKDLPPQSVVSASGNVLGTPEELEGLLQRWRREGANTRVVSCMRKWRDEKYDIANTEGWWIERCACGLLGIPTFGSHVNVFLRSPDQTLRMWIARRSYTKSTFPGLLDNAVAGGISKGDSPLDTVVRECHEEASIPPELARKARPVSCISYVIQNADVGLAPETQYIFDLEVDHHFQPKVNDGEVQEFFLVDMQDLLIRLKAGEFKPNCALVCIDFLLRHSILTPENEKDYAKIAAATRRDFWSELEEL